MNRYALSTFGRQPQANAAPGGKLAMFTRDMFARTQTKTARKGFTLVEILVVVAIIVILASAAVPLTIKYINDARRDTAQTKAKALVGTVRTFLIKHPDQGPPQSLEVLVQAGLIGKEGIFDPWGQERSEEHT